LIFFAYAWFSIGMGITATDGTRYKDLNYNGRSMSMKTGANQSSAESMTCSRRCRWKNRPARCCQTLNGGCDCALQPNAIEHVNRQQMHRFIIRNVLNAVGTCGPDAGIRVGSHLTPQQAARFSDGVQALTEATRLGCRIRRQQFSATRLARRQGFGLSY
jgi:beta-glucosidase